AIACNFFTDLPFVYRPIGDLHFWLLGDIANARMPRWCGVAHVVFAAMAVGSGLRRTREALRAGHRELRVLYPLAAVGFPLFCLGVGAFVGVLATPPPTGFLAAVVALFLAWHRLEWQAQLARKSQRDSAIGGYKCLQRIGSGGMAEVFVAEKS